MVVFLKLDGIVFWKNVIENKVEMIDNIEVYVSYIGFGVNLLVFFVVVDWLV